MYKINYCDCDEQGETIAVAIKSCKLEKEEEMAEKLIDEAGTQYLEQVVIRQGTNNFISEIPFCFLKKSGPNHQYQ